MLARCRNHLESIHGGVKAICTFWEMWNAREGLNEGSQLLRGKQGRLDISVSELLNRLGHQRAAGKTPTFQSPYAILSAHEWKRKMANSVVLFRRPLGTSPGSLGPGRRCHEDRNAQSMRPGSESDRFSLPRGPVTSCFESDELHRPAAPHFLRRLSVRT